MQITAYAIAVSWPVVVAMYVDVEFGKNDERTAVQRLLEDAQRGRSARSSLCVIA